MKITLRNNYGKYYVPNKIKPLVLIPNEIANYLFISITETINGL